MIVSNVSASVGGVMKPVGFENRARDTLGRLRQGRRPIRSGTMTPA